MNVQAMIQVLQQHILQQLELERRHHGASEEQCAEVIAGLAAKLAEPEAAIEPVKTVSS